MDKPHRLGVTEGPFRVDQLREGDRYELSGGHPLWCAPTGGSGARGSVSGAEVLDSAPDVDSTGIDAGFALDDKTLRAPDVAVGNVPDAPGWIRGVPPLAVEYASTGQDEADLQTKIAELLDRGTRWVWVVRLVGPRRVEVHERDRPLRLVGPGEELRAPGVLRNPVPIEALFDRAVAHKVTLRNLLQREGYDGIEAVREAGREAGREEGREEGRQEGRAEGRAEALVEAVESLCLALDIPLSSERRAGLTTLDVAGLRELLTRLRTARRWD